MENFEKRMEQFYLKVFEIAELMREMFMDEYNKHFNERQEVYK